MGGNSPGTKPLPGNSRLSSAARPYASWEHGTNENTNGWIRQYFPRNRDFTTITTQDIDTAMERLNNRP